MRLATIWTSPAMSMKERLYRTIDWAAAATAAHLPKRIRYWAFIQAGAAAIPSDAVVTDQYFVDVLARVEGGPR